MTLKSETYFSLPDVPWMVVIVVGLYILFGSLLLPSIVPFTYLGPLGFLASYLKEDHPGVLTFLAVFTVVCHVGESIYCMKMCGQKNISESSRVKWFLSTMVFGGASLYKLNQYKQSATKLKD